jgi:hypothetical protein
VYLFGTQECTTSMENLRNAFLVAYVCKLMKCGEQYVYVKPYTRKGGKILFYASFICYLTVQ